MNGSEENEQNVVAWFRALSQAIATGGGIRSFVDCLNAANETAQDPKFRGVVDAITGVVALDVPLTRAMGLFPAVFNKNHVAVVYYGSMYGELDLTLARYADHPEERFRRCRVPPPPSPERPAPGE